jgi:sugar phosphate permease
MQRHDFLDPKMMLTSSGIGRQRPSRVRYQVLVAACTAAAIAYVHRNGFAVALTDVAADFHLEDRHKGYLSAAFLLAYGAFEVPCGVLSDRFGVRALLPLLVIGWSVLTGAVAIGLWLPGWWMPFAVLLALRFLFGACQAGLFPALSRMMTDWMPLKERATAQGFIWMASRVGGAAAPHLFPWLVVLCSAWQPCLWALAGLGLIWAAAFWPWFRNRPDEMRAVNEAERRLIAKERAVSSGHVHIPWRRLLRSRNVWMLCAMYGCVGFAANFFITLLSDYLIHHRHVTLDQKAWLASLPFACGVGACIAGGYLSDRLSRLWLGRKWGRRINGMIGLSIAAIALLATIWVDDIVLLGLLLCLGFAGNDLNMGPAWAACADIGERHAGTVGGAMNMVGNIIGAVGMALAGRLLDANLDALVFILFACSYTLAAICWLGIDASKPLETSA